MVKFSDGIPKRKEERDTRLIYPEELIGKTCGGCVRCEIRVEGGYHCTMQNYDVEIDPDDKACVEWWDKEEYLRVQKLHEKDIENRRNELWAIYAEKEPIKLPIEYDGWGLIPRCPICGEMPHSTEQCHWCGQRFIQDEEIKDYATPKVEHCNCSNCGAPGVIHISKYNGHRSFRCEACGSGWME